jgi:hypothetical protein
VSVVKKEAHYCCLHTHILKYFNTFFPNLLPLDSTGRHLDEIKISCSSILDDVSTGSYMVNNRLIFITHTIIKRSGPHRCASAANIGLNGKFLRFRRDGVSISYTVIGLSHFDVCLAIT